jgi:hypothetical protein
MTKKPLDPTPPAPTARHYRCPLISPPNGQCMLPMYHGEPDHVFDPRLPWTVTIEEMQAALAKLEGGR